MCQILFEVMYKIPFVVSLSNHEQPFEQAQPFDKLRVNGE